MSINAMAVALGGVYPGFGATEAASAGWSGSNYAAVAASASDAAPAATNTPAAVVIGNLDRHPLDDLLAEDPLDDLLAEDPLDDLLLKDPAALIQEVVLELAEADDGYEEGITAEAPALDLFIDVVDGNGDGCS